jgi:hypothetical protein
MMKKWLLLMMFSILLFGCSEEATEIIEEEIPVRIAETKVELVEESYITIGEVISIETEELYLGEGNTIVEIFVEDGVQVMREDPLYSYKNLEDELIIQKAHQNGQVILHGNQGLIREGQLIMKIVNPNNKAVETMISSELYKQVTIGEEVMITLEDDTSLKGEIRSLSLETDPISKLHKTHIYFESEEVILGEYAELKFIVDSYEAVMVPSLAIVRKNGEKYIYQYVDDQVIKVAVETGLSSGEWIELVGMTESDFQYIISGQNFISQDDKIVVVE